MALLIGTAIAATLIGSRRLLRDWGATKVETHSVFSGDELVPDPAVTVTRAVTVDASAQEVWRWLVQIGQDRGGMYSYDWLGNLVGLGMRSTEWIKPEWQSLDVGDDVRLVRPGWLGLRHGYALHVAQLEPERSLVLQDDTFHSVWSFHVRPMGLRGCRLVSRSRGPQSYGAQGAFGELFDPITFLMTRGLLLGIKRRAEEREHALSASTAGWLTPPAGE